MSSQDPQVLAVPPLDSVLTASKLSSQASVVWSLSILEMLCGIFLSLLHSHCEAMSPLFYR